MVSSRPASPGGARLRQALLIVHLGAPAKTATEAIATGRNSPVDCGSIPAVGAVFAAILALLPRWPRQLPAASAADASSGSMLAHSSQAPSVTMTIRNSNPSAARRSAQPSVATVADARLDGALGIPDVEAKSKPSLVPAALHSENPSAPPRPRPCLAPSIAQPSRSNHAALTATARASLDACGAMRYAFIGRAVRTAESHKVAARG